jgi:hypothetical protein
MDDVKRRITGTQSNFLKSPSCSNNLIAFVLRRRGDCGGIDAGWSDEHNVWTACTIPSIKPCVRSCCCCRRCFLERLGSGVSGDRCRFLRGVSASNSPVSLSSICMHMSGRYTFKTRTTNCILFGQCMWSHEPS